MGLSTSPVSLEARGAAGAGLPAAAASLRPLRLLAYVHLRNIHRSTGAGRVARQLVEHLAGRPDVELHLLADARDHRRILPLVGAPWTSFPTHLFPRDTSLQQAQWFWTGQPPASRFWPEAQVIFCTGESYVPPGGARLVVTLHDAAYFEAGAHRQSWAFRKQRWKWKLLYGKLARKADLFHTVSAFSAERLAHFFPAIRSRLRVVPNGVAPEFFGPVPPAGREFVRAAGLAARPFVLLPGGLHYRKNAELVLAAVPLLARRFPGLVVAVVNHSDPAYAAGARALGLRMLGFVSDAELHALYAAAAVVWFPSRYEGFGMPVLEAMAAGTAVVASRASSIPEVAGEAALLADPASPSAHAEAIGSLLEDEQARGRLEQGGRARAARFTWTAASALWKGYVDALL